MSRPIIMRQSLGRSFSFRLAPLLALSLIGAWLPAALAEDDKPQPAIEVYDWSIWVTSPAQLTLNGTRVYKNAMPGVVGTSRPKLEGKELVGKFPIAPISVVQFFGEPSRDLDIDLRVKKGTLVAHWPPGSERAGRIQWFKSDLTKALAAGVPLGFLPEAHWLPQLRKVESALYHQRESRAERFLAYDTELAIPIPLKLRGGPDEYTLQNLTGLKLLDVAVIAPTDGGYRVGWLDELPSATPEGKDEGSVKKAKEKEEQERKKKPASEKANEVFEKAETDAKKEKDKDKEKDEPKPLPAEGDADVRARVDQILNRPINVNVEQAPRKEVLDLVTGQARVRYELDDKTLIKEEVDLGKTMSLKAPNIAARDALAEVLGTIGLSYRVTEDGSLFITTAARLAEDSGKKGAVIEGPPVKLTLSKPLKASDPSYRELTRDSYTRRLAAQGLRDEVIESLLGQYSEALFAPDGLIVLAHFSRDAIDDAVLLDVFPSPKKFVRTAALVMHGIDPRLQDKARELVQKLGDPAPKARETAETQLFDLGPVAVPVLEDALRDKDVEIVFRAERLLLKLNRQVP
ncbi:hypothetical protein [Singulisphaera acidiphila]|uniref:Secretin/TonB short N-terminal domain-containing protein n=1 Tax=Singulisphaera acidiphila (strain ATCC BAA-1392 / DSM 18658 / VKM B-2454 / MOB10) TaxID=886293 RepID=L0DFP8_SINAD|nr:hypothetical protein [Singulisphaera acidiphila]AGA28199.1 hypothetical protein Sinac_3974 [Singulisphaera acidiphila DSM 18658]